ncbi:ATP-dependent helicase [Methanobacterium paludis]|uniref:DNA 3'-5' helicase n=1 Tax=Methanobacterium paludis (strain DSM 25820 / JCM 18151 / SWAN1) TaxID=868131 RepID=F6D1N9_METPW|nr:ATP-dependent helicase [Methanobacterium paludis]AEG17842.1 UvrD/REP helicase [Methanobacterium paludis]
MLTWSKFQKIVIENLNRDIREDKNPDQNRAISANKNESQFIVAGPGSGKTTVMVLKILKFIYVDDVNPGSILATTFTRKAAAELRSRILSWGDQIRQRLLEDPEYKSFKTRLQRLDFNQIITGTLDSISEDILRNHRDPGSPPPVVIEDFVANALMMRVGLFKEERHHNEDLKDFLIGLRGTKFGFNTNEMSKNLLEIKDRVYYDQVRWEEFQKENKHPGAQIACDAINDYVHELQERLLFDFAILEADFLDKLRDKKLESFLQELKLVLVDEYQDTNLLQEQIYFELARSAINNGGSFTVVGDDDQSLYRFRGATVDLFTNFKDRTVQHLQIEPELINLSRNYRSTESIVNFCNRFALLDNEFQEARVEGKPPIEPARMPEFTDFPVLGMFRDDVETLAEDLSRFIHQVIYDGFHFTFKNKEFEVRADPEDGSPTDVSILLSSPLEITAFKKKRLPFYLREDLGNLNPPIDVFNPRGQNLERTDDAGVFCGLLLECIDPQCQVQDSIEKLPKTAVHRLNSWRETAQMYVETEPEPRSPISLGEFVAAWQSRTPLGRKKWKRDVPLLDLAYKLVTWIPSMQDDVEGLVYLEAITRTIAQTALFSSFGGDMIFDEDVELELSSIKELFWNVFTPLATGAIDVDENLLETLPDNRINIMSIHQSKGLEFPVVIVDVGSDFRTNHHKNAFKRFPEEGGKSCNLEDELRACSPLESPNRSGQDRAFDDLIRQYFVAFSRPQDVLLLVGINPVKGGYETKHDHHEIPNVATGWSRDGSWHWPGLENLKQI